MHVIPNQPRNRSSYLRLVPTKVSEKCYQEILCGVQNIIEHRSVAFCTKCNRQTDYAYSIEGKICIRCGSADVLRQMDDGIYGTPEDIVLRTLVFDCDVETADPIDSDGYSLFENCSLIKLHGSYYPALELWTWLQRRGFLSKKPSRNFAM